MEIVNQINKRISKLFLYRPFSNEQELDGEKRKIDSVAL